MMPNGVLVPTAQLLWTAFKTRLPPEDTLLEAGVEVGSSLLEAQKALQQKSTVATQFL